MLKISLKILKQKKLIVYINLDLTYYLKSTILAIMNVLNAKQFLLILDSIFRKFYKEGKSVKYWSDVFYVKMF